MMRQKIVLEVYMPRDKCKKKARKIVALSEGMMSMAIEAEKNQLVGVGIDTAILATSLQKKVGRTTIVSVEEVKLEDKKKEEEEAKKNEEEEARNVPWRYNNCYNYAPPPPSYPGYDVRYGAPSYPNSWFSW